MDNDSIHLTLDQEIYSLLAIRKAAYDFTDKAFFKIEKKSSDKISVSIIIKDNTPPETIQDFLNCVLDHQVRYDLELEFGKLREIIANQAFTPIAEADLEKLIKSPKNEI